MVYMLSIEYMIYDTKLYIYLFICIYIYYKYIYREKICHLCFKLRGIHKRAAKRLYQYITYSFFKLKRKKQNSVVS